MTGETLRPIETVVGFLSGRSAIFLDEFSWDTYERLTLAGSFQGVLGSKPIEDEIDYEMRFRGVLAFTVVELESSRAYDFEERFSFAEVVGSRWLPQLAEGDKFTPEHRHYFVQTYDDVVEVVATDVEVVDSRPTAGPRRTPNGLGGTDGGRARSPMPGSPPPPPTGDPRLEIRACLWRLCARSVPSLEA